MKKIERLKKKTENFLFDHFILREALYNGQGFLIGLLAAAIFAFGFTCFVSPAVDSGELPPFTIITGGVSGVSQNIALVLSMCGIEIGKNAIQAIGYFAINLPILIFAFFKISKRFAVQTLLNVAESSVLIMIFTKYFSEAIASNVFLSGSVLTRALLAAITTGLSSAIAFKGDFSCGGIDVFSYYFALRKSTSVGKYAIAINFFIVSLYSVLLIIDNPGEWDYGVVSLLYSIIYLFVVGFVVDLINLRNKKVQIEIITTKDYMGQILIANFPHGATCMNGKGVYSGSDRFVIKMIASDSEIKKVIKVAKKADPTVFITVSNVTQVYGNFFIKPVN